MSQTQLAADVRRPAEPVQDGLYPASLAQQRFWVLDRLQPGNPALNVAVRWRLEGDLPVAVIQSAFDLLAARHEPLRTCFVESEGEPSQVVKPDARVRIASIDLTALPEPDALAECDRIARAEAITSFDLKAAPLVRVTHVRVRHDLALMLVTTHHTVCDGWSIGILAKEMGEACDALQSGRQPRFPDLAMSYGEFSLWQRKFVRGGSLSGDVEYWSEHLNGLEYFSFPADRPRAASGGASSTIRSVLLDRALSDALAALARREGCTLFMIVASALLTVLNRFTGATDIAIGTQVAGRQFEELENLVGLFINTLVLRTDLSGDPSFLDLARRVRRVVSDALDHELMPIEKVIEIIKPKRYPGHNAIFSVNFIFQRSFVQNSEYRRFKLVDVPSFSTGAMYDLNFFMVERPEGWRLSCELNESLYQPETVDRVLHYLRRLMGEIARNPSRTISALPLLDSEERRALVESGHEGAVAFANNKPLPLRIVEQADVDPDAVAVTDEERSLTYRELRSRSEALAAALLERGVKPADRIGVLVGRTVDLAAAPLAVMLAGGVYVPLDPQFPESRLQQIVEQSRLSCILADRADLPGALKSGPIVLVADCLRDPARAVAGRLWHSPSADDTAYIMFTSGSTGRPKGVQIPHRALSNFVSAMQVAPGFGPEDAILAVTTSCFDISILELFLPLTVGGRVIVADERTVRDGRALLERLRGSNAGVLQATPTTWRLLIEAGWRGDPQLRMLCGGEPMPPALAHDLLERSPELWNLYGPTETTIWSSAQRIARDDPPTIGRPIANTQFYVVDKHMELVPQGALGELVIGGEGVAAGYWDAPDLTTERFVEDRFQNSGRKLYRTGDIVRSLGGGRLQFLGRADDQVKLRGFRIELGEIEAVIRQHPLVVQAVAILGEDGQGEPAIIAYAELSRTGDEVGRQVVGELRSRISQELPAYMRPSAVQVVPKIPVAPSGKIDRKILPRSIRQGRPDVSRQQVATAMEEKLREVWRSVLGVETIADDSDFFDLGGHSLLAARLLARVETVTGRRIDLGALFDAPTFAAFRDLALSSQERSFDFRQVVRFTPNSERSGVFAINNTGIYLQLSRRLGATTPLTALQLFDPAFALNSLPETVEEIAERYNRLLLQIRPSGPYVLIGWCNGGVVAFEMARQLREAGKSVSRVIVVDTWIPGYLRRGGWLRSKLTDLAYRWKLVLAEARDVGTGQVALSRFLDGRRKLHRILKLFGRHPGSPNLPLTTAEQYDRWLVTYLDQAIEGYRPQPFDGRMTVLRSSREPRGFLLDPDFGWKAVARGGVDLIVIPGNHFSVFQEPGVSLIAAQVESAVAASDD